MDLSEACPAGTAGRAGTTLSPVGSAPAAVGATAEEHDGQEEDPGQASGSRAGSEGASSMQVPPGLSGHLGEAGVGEGPAEAAPAQAIGPIEEGEGGAGSGSQLGLAGDPQAGAGDTQSPSFLELFPLASATIASFRGRQLASWRRRGWYHVPLQHLAQCALPSMCLSSMLCSRLPPPLVVLLQLTVCWGGCEPLGIQLLAWHAAPSFHAFVLVVSWLFSWLQCGVHRVGCLHALRIASRFCF